MRSVASDHLVTRRRLGLGVDGDLDVIVWDG
jgi:hypothetical protein